MPDDFQASTTFPQNRHIPHFHLQSPHQAQGLRAAQCSADNYCAPAQDSMPPRSVHGQTLSSSTPPPLTNLNPAVLQSEIHLVTDSPAHLQNHTANFDTPTVCGILSAVRRASVPPARQKEQTVCCFHSRAYSDQRTPPSQMPAPHSRALVQNKCRSQDIRKNKMPPSLRHIPKYGFCRNRICPSS